METNTLREIGLTDSEIKVYFALLELESSTVGKIIKKSNVPDSKIYSILEKLKEKGLVSFVIKNNVKHFQASDPKNLLRLLEEKEKKILEQKKEIEEKIIPQIEERRKLTEEKQEATVYESYDGMRSAYNLILENLKRGEEYNVFALGETYLKQPRIVRFLDNWHRDRIKHGIGVRLLTNVLYRDVLTHWKNQKNMVMRMTEQKVPVAVLIFKNHVITFVWEDNPMAVVIKSRKNYQYYKEFFEDVWRSSKSL